MTKSHDWQLKFEAFIQARQSMPFEWGVNDCTTFAADCVEAMTGIKHLPELRAYTTDLQAARVLKKHGGVQGIANAALGEPLPALMAQIGDVVLTDANGSDMLAICNGGTCIAPGKDGLVNISMDSARLCWRVA